VSIIFHVSRSIYILINSEVKFLNIADVYAVITYYLRNRDTVEKYLNNRMQLAEQVKRQNQENKDMNDIRERLLARQNH